MLCSETFLFHVFIETEIITLSYFLQPTNISLNVTLIRIK